MKSIKYLLFIALTGITSTISAQDEDWQIGGGAEGGNTQSIYRKTTYQNDFGSNTVSLWNGGYDNPDVGIVVGYVNKQWTSKYNGGVTRRENFFGDEGKRFHGMQIGLQYTPALKFGLGLRTGLYYEIYFSQCSYIKEHGWDRFSESNLYIPLHASYNIPFTRNYGISVFAGMGFQWAIGGSYTQDGHTWYDREGNSHYDGPEDYQPYGNGWPRHVNWQAEAGFNVRLDMFQFGFTYSYGLTNHRLSSDSMGTATSSRQDKMAFSIGCCF